MRKTQTDYITSSAYTNTNTFLLHLPSEQRVYTVMPGSGQELLASKTQSIYDEIAYPVLTYNQVANWQNPNLTSFMRGNATTIRRWLNTNNTYLETHTQYDQCGNVRFNWDARGNISEIQYSAENNSYAFAATTISPDPDGSDGPAVSLVTNSAYDFSTGLITSTTDANGQTFNIEYNDQLNRPTRVLRVWDGAWTRYEYGDAIGNLYVRAQTALDASRVTDSYISFDGLGRNVRSFQSEGGAWAVKDTKYDALGRVVGVSNSYRASGLGGPINPADFWTTTAYDALGRVRAVTTPDAARVENHYHGDRMLVIDQAGNKRVSQQDALGRLTTLWEIKAADAETEPVSFPNRSDIIAGYRTSYTFDALDNLRKVEQGAQSRYFAYDSASRLTRASMPEQNVNEALALTASDPLTNHNSWSVAFTYDENGNLAEKVDARGIRTIYGYDRLNRNTTIVYQNDPQSTAAITHFYDGAINGKGLLWKSETAGERGTQLTIESYDLAGRPLAQAQQFRVGSGWSPAYRVQRSYNFAGQLTAQVYPSGHTVNYEFDTVGRLTGFNGNLGDGVARAYASGIQYDEDGRMQEERFGTLTPLYHKRGYNVRGQLFEVRLSTRSRQQSAGDWNRGALLFYYSNISLAAGLSDHDNNGNVVRAEHWIPFNDVNDNTVSYQFFQDKYDYDELNRLKLIAEYENGQPSAQLFKQAYAYDRYGNRQIDISAGATTDTQGINRRQYAIETASNRLYATGDLSLAESARQMQYDKAGNLRFNSYDGAGEMFYDAENRISVAKNAAGMEIARYTYDSASQRVRRNITGQGEVWQVYGMEGEVLAEYSANAPSFIPTKEYGYRSGQLLVTAANGDEQRLSRLIQQLYRGSLGRDAAPVEAQLWFDWLAAQGSIGQSTLLAGAKMMAAYLLDSPEAFYRNRTDRQLVQDLYWTYFGRAASQSEEDYWAGRLASGSSNPVTRSELRQVCENWGEFSALVGSVWGTSSSENERTEHFLWNLYIGAVGAVPSTAQMQPHLEQMNAASASGKDSLINAAREMARAQIESQQYLNRNRTDGEYVKDLYQIFWQRTPDQSGWEHWTNQVALKGREWVLLRFTSSTAFAEMAGTLYRETLWLVGDQLGTPRMIVERTGSLSGIKRHDYLPFGEELMAGVASRTVERGYVGDNVRQQFTGKERDNETGLDYFGARYYASTMGRFTTPDPFMPSAEVTDPQTWNRYSYVLNNPLRYVDPLGLAYSDLSEAQRKLFSTYAAKHNNGGKLTDEQVYGTLDESQMATYESITYALEHTQLTDDKTGKSLGNALSLVASVDEIVGENIGGKTHLRLYANLTSEAVGTLKRSKEFGDSLADSIFAKDHKRYDSNGKVITTFSDNFRQEGGLPSIQISYAKGGILGDIDIDYRGLGEGHTQHYNSDIRQIGPEKDKGQPINNYQRYIDRWPKLRQWWQQKTRSNDYYKGKSKT